MNRSLLTHTHIHTYTHTIGDSGTVSNAVDLVPIIPPRQHARVFGRGIPQPPISLPEVFVSVKGDL
jgi:hypothetical protein